MAWATPKSWASSDVITSPHEELNRIEGNNKYIKDELDWTRIGVQTHKTDWALADAPTTAQAQNIDDNIREIAQMYHLPYTIRNWSGIVRADWVCLNDWEGTLLSVKPIADLGEASLRFCGTMATGEDGDIY